MPWQEVRVLLLQPSIPGHIWKIQWCEPLLPKRITFYQIPNEVHNVHIQTKSKKLQKRQWLGHLRWLSSTPFHQELCLAKLYKLPFGTANNKKKNINSNEYIISCYFLAIIYQYNTTTGLLTITTPPINDIKTIA